jgi:hypothetical protein
MGSKIGQYSVLWNSEPLANALELVRHVPPNFISTSADQVIGRGERFAYNVVRAGELCVRFEAAKRAYMERVLEVPLQNKIPNLDDLDLTDPQIEAFFNSIP